MKLFKKHIKTSSTSTASFPKFYNQFTKNPFFDWALIFVLSIIVVVILIVSDSRLYFSVIKGDIQSSNSSISSTRKSFDQNALLDVIKIFAKKEATSREAKRGYNGVTDPSI